MEDGKDSKKHIDELDKLILDLKNVHVSIEEEDQGIILLSFLPKSYKNIVDALLYGKQTLTMTEVMSVLVSKQLQRIKLEEKHESVGNILAARGSRNSSKRCFHFHKEGHFKRNCSDLLKRKGVRPMDGANIVGAVDV
ncbi:hypothetical protein KFK09_028629 [Dendrobium nobile]|uniref:Retrovirus-related Pol polyprotein from transposon TNT 1-94 n=1 Tax=Dendrobium nobile TaxID=94219 RepID=A0A8T3A415_DENNO|nr:hypothetical protein KFK09_028629 [Dendrobium nobile]